MIPGASQLPPVDTALIPADVKAKGPEAQQVYAAALGFERQLVVHLAKALQSSAESEGEDGAAAGGAYRELLPGALADGLAAGGGLGLADELYRSLTLDAGAGTTPPASDAPATGAPDAPAAPAPTTSSPQPAA